MQTMLVSLEDFNRQFKKTPCKVAVLAACPHCGAGVALNLMPGDLLALAECGCADAQCGVCKEWFEAIYKE